MPGYNPSTLEGTPPPEVRYRLWPLDPFADDPDGAPTVSFHGQRVDPQSMPAPDYDNLMESGLFLGFGGPPAAPQHGPGMSAEQAAAFEAWRARYAAPHGPYQYFYGPVTHGPADWTRYTRFVSVFQWQRYDPERRAFIATEGPPPGPGGSTPTPPVEW